MFTQLEFLCLQSKPFCAQYAVCSASSVFINIFFKCRIRVNWVNDMSEANFNYFPWITKHVFTKKNFGVAWNPVHSYSCFVYMFLQLPIRVNGMTRCRFNSLSLKWWWHVCKIETIVRWALWGLHSFFYFVKWYYI